ncbi:MAG TPA: hypothetical protein VM935_00940 [Chitinophagaceae bacterium]|nr:hypothetical protein [Chitinophagaceae bacterium]
MALSRIWSAFIIVAVLVAGIRMASGNKAIFNRMVVGKSSDPYDSVYYVALGDPKNQNLSGKYAEFLREYGYARRDSAQGATVLLTDNMNHDSVSLIKALNPAIKVHTYLSI